jgi:HPt (histidine-containing phosphotransfer) domain-containing protein
VDACTVLFEGVNLSSDEVSQAVNALAASLGENMLAYEMNAHCLPREIKRRRADGQDRTLDLSWNPITNDEDVIEKILVTLRDVTELRALEEEAHDRKEELQFIGELINVTPEAFRRFIQSCHDFIYENRKLLNSQSLYQKDLEVLKVLFINMHTMKGAARSLYFKKMTRIFHDVEQYYALLQRDP